MKARPRYYVAVFLMSVFMLYSMSGLLACAPTKGDEGPKTYTVSYLRGADDATGDIPIPEKHKEGGDVVIRPSTTFARDGYKFTVWSDGENTYAAGSKIAMPDHDLTLTAEWEKLDLSTDITATEIKFENGMLIFGGKAGGGVKTVAAYLYNEIEKSESYKSSPNINSDRAFTARISLGQLAAEPGSRYYLMTAVNGGEKTKVEYDGYNKDEVYEYGSRKYRWEYDKGIAIAYEKIEQGGGGGGNGDDDDDDDNVEKKFELDVSGTAIRAEADGHVYLSVSGTSTGYKASDFDLDIQYQGGEYPTYKKDVTATVGGGYFKVKMDISGASATASGKYYAAHLYVGGKSYNVGSGSTNPYIIETTATDDGNIYRLKSAKAWWGNEYIMQLSVERSSSKIAANDYLKVSGTDVKKNYGQGETVMLRGTNAGGYLVTECWMTAIKDEYKDYKTATEVIVNRFGEEMMQDLWGYYRSYYWSDTDFKNCADMGMTAIRLPFTYMNVDYKQDGSYDFAVLDDFVRGAAKYGIYTILDLHGAYGSQNGQDHSGEELDKASDVDFYNNAEKKAKTVALWRALAEHYKGNPAVAAFDLLNEPGEKAGTTTSKHWDFFDEMYDAIRAVDGDRIVIFESCWTGSNLPRPAQYGWENCMYSFHHYIGEDGTLDRLKAKMKERVDDLAGKNYGVPVYMGEFTCYANVELWRYTLDLFKTSGWHWASWAYKTNYQMGGWGIYYTSANKPDLVNDSLYDIKNKWRGTSTAWASEASISGTKLKDIFKQALA